MKGNKLRKKSRLKDSKLIKEKEVPITQPISKSKAYRLNSENNSSTPMNFNDKGRMIANEIVQNRSIGKSSANSFVFMKNSVTNIRKASSYQPPLQEEEFEENPTELTKNSGMF